MILHLKVRGVSFKNRDGSSRQEIARTLKPSQPVRLIAEPLNEHDRWAVAVFTADGKQIGYLPSDARESMTLLRGEPMSAVVDKLIGGTNWFRRIILGKKSVGVVLEITKSEPDWSRWSELSAKAKKYDDAVKAANELEKSGDIDAAISAYQKVVHDIAELTERDLCASAHRYVPTPVDRLSLLLEKSRRHEEALQVIEEWQSRYDPIELHAEPERMTLKRKARLLGDGIK
ncbi:MAG: HIRAN domain-containing protein [Gammaproteobacteria bacterium]|nr:HIRAN domain-containing protein [Gammaproteobacteria bacterium]NNL50205.1 hypothetical protein [Woeseiaceae bacterium]